MLALLLGAGCASSSPRPTPRKSEQEAQRQKEREEQEKENEKRSEEIQETARKKIEEMKANPKFVEMVILLIKTYLTTVQAGDVDKADQWLYWMSLYEEKPFVRLKWLSAFEPPILGEARGEARNGVLGNLYFTVRIRRGYWSSHRGFIVIPADFKAPDPNVELKEPVDIQGMRLAIADSE